ncbi:recombinase family protein [Actinoallomurus sp. NPDC052274]|uniref:recombinase family protein n=1 Tax=Actinoallomurus sp. NPDC052274 TaxID=3155420 RepID=UPI00344AD3EB
MAEPRGGGLRFAFYGRVSTEDRQDPVTSQARQRDQATALVGGHGRIVTEFFDVGQSRVLPWARRPQAAALVAAMADPDRAFDAIVIGEYERAFYGNQFSLMAPLFEHYGVQLWMPEAGGRIDFEADGHEQLMIGLVSSPSGRSLGPRSGCARRWRPRPASKAGIWAADRPTATGWWTRARIRTGHTLRGGGAPIGWNQTRRPRRS